MSTNQKSKKQRAYCEISLRTDDTINVFETVHRNIFILTLRILHVSISQSPFLLFFPPNFHHPLNFLNRPHTHTTLTLLNTYCFLEETALPIFNQHTILPFRPLVSPSRSVWNPSHPPEMLPSMCCIYVICDSCPPFGVRFSSSCDFWTRLQSKRIQRTWCQWRIYCFSYSFKDTQMNFKQKQLTGADRTVLHSH